MNKKICFCTIINFNYLPYAVVLAQSLLKTHNTKLHVLIVEKKSDNLISHLRNYKINYYFIEDLNIKNMLRLAFKYNVTELCTAVKPAFLLFLLKLNFKKIIYLDPDIYIYEKLHYCINLLDKYSIVLTPHSTSPSLDGFRPSDIDFLRNGSFNLGFIAISNQASTLKFLNWWNKRCLSFAFADTNSGLFVDQKWIDLIQCYFDSVFICKHQGYNVSYWNIHHRKLKWKKKRFYAQNKKLVFFHFSGLPLDDSRFLSRHCTRPLKICNIVLFKLVGSYKRAIVEQYNKHKLINYSFSYFNNGMFIPDYTRRFLLTTRKKITNPFDEKTSFYRNYNSFFKRNKNNIALFNTLNFDENNIIVRAVNFKLRLLAAVFGKHRVLLYLQYCSFLTRSSNYFSVLQNRPLDLQHTCKGSL